MSKSYNSLREDLIRTANDPEYRHAYADESLNLQIATQLKVLREQREWTQEFLAREANMKQSMISRYENVNYSSWSINTLKKLARAYDVFLDVRFRTFGELVESVEKFGRKALEVASFADDPFFKEEQPLTVQSHKVRFVKFFSSIPPTQSIGSIPPTQSIGKTRQELGSVTRVESAAATAVQSGTYPRLAGANYGT